MREKLEHLRESIKKTIQHPLMPQDARLNLLALGSLLEEIVADHDQLRRGVANSFAQVIVRIEELNDLWDGQQTSIDGLEHRLHDIETTAGIIKKLRGEPDE